MSRLVLRLLRKCFNKANAISSAADLQKQWLVLMRRLFNVCVRVSCAPNAAILLVYIPTKWVSSKKIFFFLLKSAFFVRLVQAYTQAYSFSGRIKLIICQITHELSVTIHEISTWWKKKNVWCRTQYLLRILF